MKSDTWYVQQADGRVNGPISEWELFELIGNEKLKATDWISPDGKEYKPAVEVLGTAAFTIDAPSAPIPDRRVVVQERMQASPTKAAPIPAITSSPGRHEETGLVDVVIATPLLALGVLYFSIWQMPYIAAGAMTQVLLLALFISSALMVYRDAKANGNLQAHAAPGTWAAATLIFWPIAVPIYVVTASDNAARRAGAILFSILLSVAVGFTFQASYKQQAEIQERLKTIERGSR